MAEKCFFEKIYGASEEVLKGLKKAPLKRRLKRKFASALDDAEMKKIDAEEEIEKARENFEDYDINVILEKRLVINQLEAMQEYIKVEYLYMFGKEMSV